MERRLYFSFVATAMVVLPLGFSSSSGAQQAPPAAPAPPSIENMSTAAFGMAPFLMGNNARQNSVTDPTRSNYLSLALRDDVHTELRLTGMQREALMELQNKSRKEMIERMRANVQEMLGARGVSRRPAPAKPNTEAEETEKTPPTPEERRAQMLEQGNKIITTMTGYRDEMDKKVEAILSSGQMRRLRQLDLRWRGPLALADTKVAEQVQLSPEQSAEVLAALREFQAAQMKAMQSAFTPRPSNEPTPPPNGQADGNATTRRPANPAQPNAPSPGAPGQNGNRVGGAYSRNIDPRQVQEIEARLEAARKESEKARKAAGDKALTALVPEQRQMWQTLLGKPFAFRAIY